MCGIFPPMANICGVEGGRRIKNRGIPWEKWMDALLHHNTRDDNYEDDTNGDDRQERFVTRMSTLTQTSISDKLWSLSRERQCNTDWKKVSLGFARGISSLVSIMFKESICFYATPH